MSDEYIGNDIEEFYYNLADDEINPDPVDSNKADALLYCITRERGKINKINAEASDQIVAVGEWRDAIVAKHEKVIDHMTAGLQEYFSRLVADDPKLKTKSFPNGVMKLRKQQPLLHIDDKELFFMNLGDRHELARVTTKHDPDKKAIMEHIKTTGEIPEGCRLEVRNDKFSINTNNNEGQNDK